MLNNYIIKIYTKGYCFLKRNNKGQSLVEYGLIIALIAMVAIAVLTSLGSGIKETFQKILDALPTSK